MDLQLAINSRKVLRSNETVNMLQSRLLVFRHLESLFIRLETIKVQFLLEYLTLTILIVFSREALSIGKMVRPILFIKHLLLSLALIFSKILPLMLTLVVMPKFGILIFTTLITLSKRSSLEMEAWSKK